MAIHCCNGCVPPKRTPTCKFDGTCNRYAESKAKHDAEKAAADRKKAIDASLNLQKLANVEKAYKAQRKLKGR